VSRDQGKKYGRVHRTQDVDRVLGDAGTADICTCDETDRGSGNSRQHVACSTNTDVVTDGNQSEEIYI
jgi:hypothetical protein